MFNVLPENLKAEIKSEYRFRYVVFVLILLILFLVFFVISILPSWVISIYKEQEIKSLIRKEQESVLVQDANYISNIIDSTNKKLVAIDSVMDYPEIIPIYKTILSNKSSNIKIKDFSYIANATSSASVVVRGVANSRESLVYFVKKMESSGEFKEVISPVSNLAKQKDIDFVINLKVEK